MMRSLLLTMGILTAMVAALVAWQLPELKRYLKIRDM